MPVNPLRKILVTCLFFAWTLPAFAQAETRPCGLRISLLTSGPAPELYAIWGHSALRVVDSAHFTDLVFNYGTFDFSTKFFYLKFARGTLLYALSYEPFDYFQEDDRLDGRKLTEQVLNLDCADKERIYQYLISNYQPEKRFYRYNFLYDNCSTRIRDLLESVLGSRLRMGTRLAPPGYTYREGFDYYLKPYPWTRLGIDILLGLPTDIPAGPAGIQFLPDYLERAVGQASLDGHPLDTTEKVLLLPTYNQSLPGFFSGPLMVFSLVFLLLAGITFLKPRIPQALLHGTDLILFLVPGLAGCLMLLLWLGTEHRQCAWNLNLLWALPTHVVFSLSLGKKRKWTAWYGGATAVLGIALLIAWAWLPQPLPIPLIPLTAALVIRSWKVWSSHHRPGPAQLV